MLKRRTFLWLQALLIMVLCGTMTPVKTIAQAAQEDITVQVTADHPDWLYKTGENAVFTISVLQSGVPLENVKIGYKIGKEKVGPFKTGSLILKKKEGTLDAGTLKMPGFLRCIATVEVDGKQYRGLATAAYEPENIKPTASMPDDFEKFWKEAREEAIKIPMDITSTLLPERCTETIDVYHISFQNYEYGSRIYGIVCIPKKDGKYPAILNVPGAGVRAYRGDVTMAEEGFITLQIGIHGIPVTMEDSIYKQLAKTEKYQQYRVANLEDRDQYYFKRVYLGCVRAIDYLFSLPKFDGKRLAVAGGSQGGALSIVTAALDNRVKYLVPYCPALCDLTGYLHDRAGGWPHMFSKKSEHMAAKIKTSGYYDVVNFARLLKVPGFYSWGFNDETCPPTSMYSAYNVISAPKELFIVKDVGHWYYPIQHQKKKEWLKKMLSQ